MVLGSMPAFSRAFELFWFHILLTKNRVDVVPGERQSFAVMVFTAPIGTLLSNCSLWRTPIGHNVFTKIDITAQEDRMHVSVRADAIFVAF